MTGEAPRSLNKPCACAAVDWLTALILGIVQGLTEWLPVSSSGHLALAQHLTDEEPPLLFDIVLHLGTLLMVLWVLRAEVGLALRALPRLARRLGPSRTDRQAVLTEGSQAEDDESAVNGDEPLTPEERMVLLVLLGCIPTAIFGLVIDRWFIGALYERMELVGLGLLCTAVVLWVGRRPHGNADFATTPLRTGLWVGLAQGLAVVPGISRSGFTIAVGQLAGLEPRTAARLSFLLFIPAVVGAALFKLGDAGAVGSEVGLVELAVGTTAAMVTGLLALKLLITLVERQRFHWFVPYCVVLGLALVWMGGTG